MDTIVKKERLLSIRYVAGRLGLSVRAVYRLIARKAFPGWVKVGGASRWYESDVDDYLIRLREARKSR